MDNTPIFADDTIVFGLLMLALGFVFLTESIKTGFWPKFYKIVPGLFMAYMLPAILALVMFFTGTIGIIIGGPIAILLIATFSPETVGGIGPDAVWRGLSTLAGSWIGGGANQTAMLEIYGYNQAKYGQMVFVDIVVANIWMAIILIGIGKRNRINKWYL